MPKERRLRYWHGAGSVPKASSRYGFQLVDGRETSHYIEERASLRIERAMTARILSNPNVMHGKAVIAGTRITVESILERLGHGESVDELLKAHPQLEGEDIQAALRFGAEALKADVVYPISDDPA